MLTTTQLEVALDAEAGIVKALAGLSLTIRQGQTFALVGESGCGKSMTALALMRLLPENGAVVGGDITLDDTDLLGLPEYRMRSVRGGRIGMIFQEPGTSLNPVLTVGRQMVEAIETHTALRGDAARTKAIDWLKRVGIPEPERRIDDYPFRMSGGQKQRVMIAMTLACEPDYLVADEPTTALDVTIQAQILGLLADLQREHGMGLLLITHDLAVVAGMADQVALMYAGQIIEVAPAAQFFAKPQHPYARALMQALPGAGRRDQALAAIPGTVPPLTQDFTGCRFAPRCVHAQPACHVTAPLLTGEPGQQVRCLLLVPGGSGLGGVEAAMRVSTPFSIQVSTSAATAPAVTAPALSVPALAARASAVPLLQVKDLCVSFSLPKRVLRARRRASRRSAKCLSTLPPVKHWHWWASQAAARPPPARRSCNCCAARPRSADRRCSTAATCSSCKVPRCVKLGARFKSSFRTRSLR